MNSKPNSLTLTKPNSPIPTTPNSPTTTPPRSTTPSDLFLQITAFPTRRTMGPIFDNSILPSHWNTEMKEALVIHIEGAIMIKEMMIAAILDVKYSLPIPITPPADQLALITSLISMMEKYETAKLLIDRFTKYLSYEKQQVIEALITSEPLKKLMKDLLSTPAVLALSLQQMIMNDSQPSGSC